MKTEKLNEAMESLKSDLGQGLIATDVWIKGTGQSIASYQGNLKAVALFDKIIMNIERALKVSEYPAISDYFAISLKGNKYIVVILEGDLEWAILVDGTKTQLGMLLNITLPNAIEALKKAK